MSESLLADRLAAKLRSARLRRSRRAHQELPACRVCLCTEVTPCEMDDGPCGWASANLCTACEGRPAEIFDTLAALYEAVTQLGRAMARARKVLGA